MLGRGEILKVGVLEVMEEEGDVLVEGCADL